MLPTITSRCDVINIRYGSNTVLDLLDINEDDYEKYYNEAKKVIDILNMPHEYERLAKISYLSNKEREDILRIFKLVYRIYVIKFENIANNLYNNLEYARNVLDLIDISDIELLTSRIKLLESFLNDYKYNVNKDLFINKLCIEWR